MTSFTKRLLTHTTAVVMLFPLTSVVTAGIAQADQSTTPCVDDTCSSAPAAVSYEGKPYGLVWHDEFNGSMSDAWNLSRSALPVERHSFYYRDSKDKGDIQQHDGYVTLAASQSEPNNGLTNNTGKTDPAVYTAALTTRNKKSWKYGIFETRIRLHQAPGATDRTDKFWPAIWFMPNEGPYGWPADGELDWLEHYPNGYNIVYTLLHHTEYTNNTTAPQIGSHDASVVSLWDSYSKYTNRWVTLQMVWTKTGITFFVDGRKVGSTQAKIAPDGSVEKPMIPAYSLPFKDPATGKYLKIVPEGATAPFDKKMYLIIDLAALVDTAQQAGQLDYKNAKFDIDYVRVYQTPEQQAEQDQYYVRYQTWDQAIDAQGNKYNPPAKSVAAGSKLGALPVLRSKDGKQASFGWSRRQNPAAKWAKVNADSPAKANYTLFPEWSPANWVFEHNPEAQGANALTQQAVKPGEAFTPAEPKAPENKSFAGWYLDPGFTTKLPDNFVPKGDTNIYAKWTEKKQPPAADSGSAPWQSSLGNDSGSSALNPLIAVAGVIAALVAIVRYLPQNLLNKIMPPA